MLNTESFEYELAIQLSYMVDRAYETKGYVKMIIKLKNHILNDEPLEEEEKQLLNRLLDDSLILTEICKTNDGSFGKFLYTHADIDAYLPNLQKNT